MIVRGPRALLLGTLLRRLMLRRLMLRRLMLRPSVRLSVLAAAFVAHPLQRKAQANAACAFVFVRVFDDVEQGSRVDDFGFADEAAGELAF